MKYLFIITGIAYGHLIREEAIISRLKKLDKKAEITIAGYGTSYSYFKKRYKVLKLNPMFFPDESNRVKFFSTLIRNYKIFLNWIINFKLIKEFISNDKPNVVVSDWEPFAMFLKECKYLIWNYKPRYAKARNILVFLEKITIEFGYFISKIFRKRIILPSLNKEESSGNFIYTSLIVRNTPDEINELSKYKDCIIVMIGGSNFGSDLANKVENISGNFDERFIFFNHKCKSRNCIGYHKFKDNYLEYLKSCKAVISLGGYSGISESIFFKKPNLAFPIKNWTEQMAVVEEFRDYIEIGDIESSEEDLKIKIKEFLINIPKIKKKLNSLRLLSNGADEIARIIYKEAGVISR